MNKNIKSNISQIEIDNTIIGRIRSAIARGRIGISAIIAIASISAIIGIITGRFA